MSWTVPTTVDLDLTPAELSTLRSINGGVDKLPEFLERAVNEVRGSITAGNYPLGASGTIPDALVSECIAIARWRWITSLPQAKAMATPERKSAFDDATKRLIQISEQNYAVEEPGTAISPSTGTWNAENKLVMRTHPVPTPGSQYQNTSTKSYANPSAPEDNS